MLGHLVEKVSGESLEAFFQGRIFEPLGMDDTAFHVPQEKVDRFAVCYAPTLGKGLGVSDNPRTSEFLKRPGLLSGGGGLVSTMGDYLRFCRMLLNKGELDGKRLLRAETVGMMTRNQLPDSVSWNGQGCGLGFSVQVTEGKYGAGEYGWGGAASTHFWIHPKHELIVIALSQLMPYSNQLAEAVKPLVYESITSTGLEGAYARNGQIHVGVFGEADGEPITTGPADMKPSGSKSGDMLVFFRVTKRARDIPDWKTAICVVKTNGTGFRKLTDGTHTDFNPTWTRDGSNLVVLNRQKPDRGYIVMLAKPDGKPGEEHAVSNTSHHTYAYSCLKDGRMLVSSSYRGGGYFLMTPGETKVCLEFQRGFGPYRYPGRTLYIADFDVTTRTIANPQAIAQAYLDIVKARKVDLSIIDFSICMEGDGRGCHRREDHESRYKESAEARRGIRYGPGRDSRAIDRHVGRSTQQAACRVETGEVEGAPGADLAGSQVGRRCPRPPATKPVRQRAASLLKEILE